MLFWRNFIIFGVSLLMVVCVTGILLLLKFEGAGQPQHAIFFYLLPTTYLAVLFGSMSAILFAIMATVCATFFLYDPVYSFYVSDLRDLGELICFAGLSMIGIKCVIEIRRPQKPLRPNSRQHRLWHRG